MRLQALGSTRPAHMFVSGWIRQIRACSAWLVIMERQCALPRMPGATDNGVPPRFRPKALRQGHRLTALPTVKGKLASLGAYGAP